MSGDPRALLQKADKTMASAGSGFSFFGGREDKYMTAADLYVEAANAFRMQGLLREAGQTFEKAAAVQGNQLKEPDDAANTYVECFKVYRKENPQDAVRCLEYAINQYCKKGNFRRAAQHKENMGEVYENDLGDRKNALECYELSAKWYEGDNATASANKLYLKVADIAALDEEYAKAIELYEKVVGVYIANNLMRYSAKDLFLKAGICHLARNDHSRTEDALNKYRDMDPTFTSTREHQLLVDLLTAMQASDTDAFENCLFLYDQMSKLDKWKAEILLRIKNNVTVENEDYS